MLKVIDSISGCPNNPVIKKKLADYIRILFDFNERINLVSRKISPEAFAQLLNETLLLDTFISNKTAAIIDAGSGSGLLGIPIAIVRHSTKTKISLVEPKLKKISFLTEAVDNLELENVEIHSMSIEEYLKSEKPGSTGYTSLISRGFPDFKAFCVFIKKHLVHETIIITSENKIKKNETYLETVAKKTYNVPLRNELKILKILPMETASRGNKEYKKM